MENWYDGHIATVLEQNSDTLRTKYDITVEKVRRNIAGMARPWDAKTVEKQGKLFQKHVTKIITVADRPEPVQRIRENISRWCEGQPEYKGERGWGISTPLGTAAHTCHRNLNELKSFLPPRVCASVFRTIANGWCTHRRFQQRFCSTNKCMFGCPGQAEDSIEHYCRCPVTLEVLRTQLNASVSPQRALSFWLMDCSRSEDMAICSALSCYAAYSTFNYYRCSKKIPSQNVAIDAMKQSIFQAVQGSSQLRGWLDNRWRANRLIFR